MKNSETKNLISGILVMLFTLIALIGFSAVTDKNNISNSNTAYAYEYTTNTTNTTTQTTKQTTTVMRILTTSVGVYNGNIQYLVREGYTYDSNLHMYTITTTIEIMECSNSLSGELEIPETINEFSVVGIQKGAFSECSKLDSIILPESVKSIEDSNTFNSNLKKLTIKNPACEIYQHWDTIPNGTVIYGYADSTAQQYAQTFGREFVVIDGQSAGTTPPVTTTPTTTTVTTEIFGDIDGNGLVDASDASCILAYYSYTSTGGTASLREFLNF